MPRKKSNSVAVKQKYEPTSREQSVLEKHLARRAAEPPAPSVKVSNGAKESAISINHPDRLVGHLLLAEALGTLDHDFITGLLSQLANAGSQGRAVDEKALNFLLSVIKGIKPRDQLEAMLAAQMAVVHVASMTFARRLANVEAIVQQDSAERALNKLTRTFTTQLEALKRYRTGGEQKVTVQHVSVSEGGQAIVGNVTQAARVTAPEKTPALTHAPKPSILGEAERAPVALRARERK